ncbi:MAG: hypothetical protein HFE94_05490 [Acutalibacter sp.]|nr:hypothetical protein [Acutalibacter sp.]
MKIFVSEKGQATPGPAQEITLSAFDKLNHTELRWLGGGGVMLNSIDDRPGTGMLRYAPAL